MVRNGAAEVIDNEAAGGTNGGVIDVDKLFDGDRSDMPSELFNDGAVGGKRHSPITRALAVLIREATSSSQYKDGVPIDAVTVALNRYYKGIGMPTSTVADRMRRQHKRLLSYRTVSDPNSPAYRVKFYQLTESGRKKAENWEMPSREEMEQETADPR